MSTEDTQDDEGVDADPPDKDVDIDEEEEESFPASDPPSTWAGQSSASAL